MKEGSRVVRSSEWHKPKTEIVVTGQGISQAISLDDFMEAVKVELRLQPIADNLKKEIGSIALTFKKDTFEKKVDAAMKQTENVLQNEIDNAVAEVLKKL